MQKETAETFLYVIATFLSGIKVTLAGFETISRRSPLSKTIIRPQPANVMFFTVPTTSGTAFLSLWHNRKYENYG